MCARARARENHKKTGDTGDKPYKSMNNNNKRDILDGGQTGDRRGTDGGQTGDRLKIYGFGTTKGGGVRSFWAEFLDRYAQAHCNGLIPVDTSIGHDRS